MYLGDAVVTNRNGKAYIRIVNINNVDKELVFPMVELLEIEEKSTKGPINKIAKINVVQSQSAADHAGKVENLLRLSHLTTCATNKLTVARAVRYSITRGEASK